MLWMLQMRCIITPDYTQGRTRPHRSSLNFSDPLKLVAQREGPPEPTDDINTLVHVWTDGFRILPYEDTEDQCDWRNRKARVLRLFARKW
jgi:hypothetical protein